MKSSKSKDADVAASEFSGSEDDQVARILGDHSADADADVSSTEAESTSEGFETESETSAVLETSFVQMSS